MLITDLEFPCNGFPPTRASLTVDASSSYLPVHFKELDISVYDINTNKQIGSGSWRGQTVPRSNYHFVTLPVEFSYAGVNASDATCE